jgi:hypothetical protein
VSDSAATPASVRGIAPIPLVIVLVRVGAACRPSSDTAEIRFRTARRVDGGAGFVRRVIWKVDECRPRVDCRQRGGSVTAEIIDAVFQISRAVEVAG